MMNITVIGTEYQGLSEAAVLSLKNHVKILKTENIDSIVLSQCARYGIPNIEPYILSNPEQALSGAEMVVISIPVFYDTELNTYYLHDVDQYVNFSRQYAPGAVIVMRSDVPVGYTQRTMSKYPDVKMVFVPDFSQEAKALENTLQPSRIVIGSNDRKLAETVCALLQADCEVLYTSTEEAESVKLFANTFLAMRVAFFNELDTYAEIRGLHAENIIKSVSLDPRIGDLYNNPSFGFGGRSLVEGACRLRNDFADIPEKIVDIVEASNEIRKKHIIAQIMKLHPKVCGIYCINLKTGAKDYRYAAVTGIIQGLQAQGVKVVIFEPQVNLERLLSADVENHWEKFVEISDVIVANRIDDRIRPYIHKLYTRDIFERD